LAQEESPSFSNCVCTAHHVDAFGGMRQRRGWLIAACAASSAAPVTGDSSCWDATSYSFDFCCNGLWGREGLSRCWGGDYSFQRCCVFHPGGGNEENLPSLSMEEIHIASAHPRGHIWHLRQNLTSGGWDEQIPGLLFKQSYAMLRFLEALPDAAFLGKRALELGAGIGLLSLHVAIRGGLATATDGSERSLIIGRRNAEANLPPITSWNRLTWRLVRWEDGRSKSQVRALGLLPPYNLVICSALLYAPTAQVHHLVRLLWACTDEHSEILWESGIVQMALAEERWSLIARCFEVVETVDAVATGYTKVEGTTVARLRRVRQRPAPGDCAD